MIIEKLDYYDFFFNISSNNIRIVGIRFGNQEIDFYLNNFFIEIQTVDKLEYILKRVEEALTRGNEAVGMAEEAYIEVNQDYTKFVIT